MIDFIKQKRNLKIIIPIVIFVVGILPIFSFYNKTTIMKEKSSSNPSDSISYDTEELQITESTEPSSEEVLNLESESNTSDYVITDNTDSSNIDMDKEETSSNSTTQILGNYDSADTNNDGVIDIQEATNHISPSEQAMIDAGFGNVVLLPTGNYGVLMPNPDHLINGKDGGDILIEYLSKKGLQANSISGSWMNDQYYNWIAKNITELITPNEEEFWD